MPAGTSSPPTTILPRNAIAIAAPRERITQTMPIVADFFISLEFLMDINLTRMWGIPKYPRPQARPETISCQLALKGFALKRFSVPSGLRSGVLSTEKSTFSVKRITKGTASRATSIIRPWKKSVQQTALKPPRKV